LNGIKVIGLTGNGGGKMNDLADVNIVVPNTNVMFIQESHLMIEHILCSLVEEHFQPEPGYNFR
jgi:D-sedoheptulose 7-phosphate isomerase